MPRCPKCKALNDAMDIHCRRCGELLRAEGTSTTSRSILPRESTGSNDTSSLLASREKRDKDTTSNVVNDQPTLFSEKEPDNDSIWETDVDNDQVTTSAFDQLVSESTLESPRSQNEVTLYGSETEGWDFRASEIVTQESPRSFGKSPTITGSVFMVRQSEEPPDRDFFLWISRFLGFCIVVEFISLLIARAYQQWGVLLLLGIFVAFIILSRFCSGLFVFALFGLARLLGPLRSPRNDRVPVRMCRILDDQQREYIVRIKGRIIRGDIDQSDRVAVWGRFREGTLLFRRGYNLRAGSWIRLEGCYSWILALVFMLMNAYLLFELHKVYP